MSNKPTYEELEKKVREFERIENDKNHAKEELRLIEWMLTKGHKNSFATRTFTPQYGDLTELNQSRLILDSVGKTVLSNIVFDYLDLLDTSAAVYELNGDYALGIFSSGWCQFMDQSSRELCGTKDNHAALSCGRWHCHESCWSKASKITIETESPVDIECNGGLRIYALPIRAGNRIIGAINVGYGNPPTDQAKLQQIAAKYGVSTKDLVELASSYKPRPPFIIELAKQRMSIAAILIGEIVERKRIEEDYRTLFREMLDGFALHEIICDQHGKPVDYKFLLLNPSFERMTGLSANEIVGKTVLEVLPETEPYWIETYGNVALTGKPVFFENYSVMLDKYFEVTAFRPAPKQFACIFADISKRKKTENDLLQEKERLLVTLRSIGDGVITTDTDGRVVLINKITEKLTGWTQQEAFGKDITEVFNIVNSKTKQQCENPVKKVLEAGTIVGLANHTNLIARDGTERMISDSGAPIFDANSQMIGVILVFRDVTEQYQIEQQLQHAQRMESIGILAGGIAHDFNNMLGVITGNISYALSRIDRNEELFQVLSDIQESSKHARSLTQQLLTFAKGGAPVKKIVDINQIIRETAKFVTRGKNSRCEFDLSNELWTVEVDPGQMNQTISNLVINADQAMPEGGIIKIKSENTLINPDTTIPLIPGKYVKISIQDQGIGISEKHLLKIFDPYFSTKTKGSGLGLSSAYSIVKRHDGYINVCSELGWGSVFHIYLPATIKTYEKVEQEEKAVHRGRGKILIMDDQELILDMAGRILNRMGYETVFAKDGSQVIDKYCKAYQSQNPFDLVILDLTIPGGMGGIKTIIELLKIDPNVKAVVSSGYSNDTVMANYADYGFCGVVPKPFTKSELAEVLNKVLL
ncbi:MAG: PAS domain S-box protein [Desulfobacterales bacterium]|nr:PAS domain S-box protein [Desulfobacterales bacterium]